MDGVKLFKYAAKVPQVLTGLRIIIGRVKGASPDAKKDAILESLKDSVSLAEFAADKDFLNDPAIESLVKAVLDAEDALQAAREALKEGIVNKNS